LISIQCTGFFQNNPEPGKTAGSFKNKCRIYNEQKSAKSGVNSNLNEHVKSKQVAQWDEFSKYRMRNNSPPRVAPVKRKLYNDKTNSNTLSAFFRENTQKNPFVILLNVF